jgi:hypothetical protein
MAHILSGPLNSPYRRAFDRLPSAIQSALWDHGCSRIQPDGELLKESLEVEQAEQATPVWETSLGKGIIEKCMEYNDLTNEIPVPSGLSPSTQLPRALILDFLSNLVSTVSCGKQTETYSLFEMQLAQQDRQACASSFAPLSELSEITKRWRHWKPRSGNHTPATTQRVMELTLRERWLERLLSPFILKQDKIRNMLSIYAAAGGAEKGLSTHTGEDILREYKHLMGTARYRTLRVHCLNLEHMMKAGLPIPWQERDFRAIPNTLLEEEATPSKVNRLWCTLAWISKKLGLLEGDSLPRL